MNCSEFMQMLDAYLDGELNADARARLERHAAQCADCHAQLKAAEQLRDFLSHMDDDVSVPLPAQAAWRSAVRAEAKRRSMKRIYSACGAVAAACVLTLGVAGMLKSGNLPSLQQQTPIVAHVEADGLSTPAADELAMNEELSVTMLTARSMDSGVNYIDRSVLTDDPETACSYLMDIVAEYGCTVERESDDSDGRRFYVLVPGENAVDFVNAVDHIGIETDSRDFAAFDLAEIVGVCVVISAQ